MKKEEQIEITFTATLVLPMKPGMDFQVAADEVWKALIVGNGKAEGGFGIWLKKVKAISMVEVEL